jgi:hypothetical protein
MPRLLAETSSLEQELSRSVAGMSGRFVFTLFRKGSFPSAFFVGARVLPVYIYSLRGLNTSGLLLDHQDIVVSYVAAFSAMHNLFRTCRFLTWCLQSSRLCVDYRHE